MDLNALWTMLAAVFSAILIVLSFGLFYYTSVFIHELGHLSAAFLVGWRPGRLCIGHGKRHTLFSFLGVDFEIGERLRGGFAHAYPRRTFAFRTSLFLFALGGPVATACSAYALYRLASGSGDFLPAWLSPERIWFFFVLEAYMLVRDLWPHMANFSGERLPNDGLLMWRSLRLKKTDIGTHFMGGVGDHTMQLLRKGMVADAKEVFDRGVVESGVSQEGEGDPQGWWINFLLEVGRVDQAREECQRLLERYPKASPKRAEVLDQLACIPLFYGRREMIADALEFVEQAMVDAPEIITLKGTKGALLIENGEVEAGMHLIEELIEESTSENDQGICAWYLALGLHMQGNIELAEEKLSLAKSKYPSCIVAQRIEAELAKAAPKCVDAELVGV